MSAKNKILLTSAALLMGAGLTLSVQTAVHADTNDVEINASQYTQSAQDLQKVFTNNNKETLL